MLDVRCPVSVVLGTGTISVRQCLSLAPRNVLRLREQAGEDVQLLVGDVPVARGEVVIVAESTAVRLTEMMRPTATGEGR
jgi:flagellar motor switch protein FliN/FliY